MPEAGGTAADSQPGDIEDVLDRDRDAGAARRLVQLNERAERGGAGRAPCRGPDLVLSSIPERASGRHGLGSRLGVVVGGVVVGRVVQADLAQRIDGAAGGVGHRSGLAVSAARMTLPRLLRGTAASSKICFGHLYGARSVRA